MFIGRGEQSRDLAGGKLRAWMEAREVKIALAAAVVLRLQALVPPRLAAVDVNVYGMKVQHGRAERSESCAHRRVILR